MKKFLILVIFNPEYSAALYIVLDTSVLSTKTEIVDNVFAVIYAYISAFGLFFINSSISSCVK
jgi:hypothetical protein